MKKKKCKHCESTHFFIKNKEYCSWACLSTKNADHSETETVYKPLTTEKL